MGAVSLSLVFSPPYLVRSRLCYSVACVRRRRLWRRLYCG